MTNNEIIFETVRNTFTPAQLAELVQATYTAEQIAARRAAVTMQALPRGQRRERREHLPPPCWPLTRSTPSPSGSAWGTV